MIICAALDFVWSWVKSNPWASYSPSWPAHLGPSVLQWPRVLDNLLDCFLLSVISITLCHCQILVLLGTMLACVWDMDSTPKSSGFHCKSNTVTGWIREWEGSTGIAKQCSLFWKTVVIRTQHIYSWNIQADTHRKLLWWITACLKFILAPPFLFLETKKVTVKYKAKWNKTNPNSWRAHCSSPQTLCYHYHRNSKRSI